MTVAFQAKRLRIAQALRLSHGLAKELSDFRVKIDPRTAHDTYGAWRDGQHDDLVLALAIAGWTAEQWFSPPAEEVVFVDDFRPISRY